MSKDQRQRFLFEYANVRGEVIHLDETVAQVLGRRTYPTAVTRVLGESLAAAGLLSAVLKFKGSLILQIQGKGSLSMLVASATHDHDLRAVARIAEDAEIVDDDDLQRLTGGGHLAITIDPDESTERYQGIVALEHPSVAQCVDAYFTQSEQLPTRIWLACDGERAAGLLLQRLPEHDHGDPDAWNRAEHLASTITEEELLELEAPDIVRRLFHEETIRLFDPEPMRFHCHCSRQRLGDVIVGLGREEAHSILEEQGALEARCDFCGASYRFDAVDIRQLFKDGGTDAAGRTRH
ncbi:molecular chaperone Hsp33 [Natronocella acetinitrilica]|uniref:33 kDa chaperonin n=1 Tax=Natronocella acetinitrilica TaxID=414046 RepID=A0AAE3G116_9GAMM|nr:Hsp33 family molecular chaperone HslO [Natronocella acetinitrilica]MCP1672959.1 molecular chaperone Hsp33 [Natronocella acetinitrilica]